MKSSTHSGVVSTARNDARLPLAALHVDNDQRSDVEDVVTETVMIDSIVTLHGNCYDYSKRGQINEENSAMPQI